MPCNHPLWQKLIEYKLNRNSTVHFYRILWKWLIWWQRKEKWFMLNHRGTLIRDRHDMRTPSFNLCEPFWEGFEMAKRFSTSVRGSSVQQRSWAQALPLCPYGKSGLPEWAMMLRALIIRINCLLAVQWSKCARIKQGGNNKGLWVVNVFSFKPPFTRRLF